MFELHGSRAGIFSPLLCSYVISLPIDEDTAQQFPHTYPNGDAVWKQMLTLECSLRIG